MAFKDFYIPVIRPKIQDNWHINEIIPYLTTSRFWKLVPGCKVTDILSHRGMGNGQLWVFNYVTVRALELKHQIAFHLCTTSSINTYQAAKINQVYCNAFISSHYGIYINTIRL